MDCGGTLSCDLILGGFWTQGWLKPGVLWAQCLDMHVDSCASVPDQPAALLTAVWQRQHRTPSRTQLNSN